jgi:CheY-like chemotaxis protein
VAGSLNILVVDDRPDSVLFLTEFLLSRKHRVSTIANGKEALAAVQRKRSAGDPFDLVITEISIPGMDGLALLKDLRRRQEPIDSAICTAYAALHPNLRQEAERLGCLAVLEKPTDLAHVDELLQFAQGRKRTAPGTTKTDQPFFGTSRIVRNDEITTSRLRKQQSAPGEGLEPRSAPGDGLERRTPQQPGTNSFSQTPPPPARMPSPLPMEEASDRQPRRQVQSFSHSSSPAVTPAPPAELPPAPAASQTGSGRVERPPAAIPLAPEAIIVPRPGEAAAAPGDPTKPLSPVTTRLRRSISGTERITRQAPPQPPAGAGVPEGSRAVGCALCGKPFVVLDKPQTYSVVCVHCGQLNRVEPIGTPPGAG